MKTQAQFKSLRKSLIIPFTLFIFSLFIYSGCKDNDIADPGAGGNAKVEGRVTDADGFGKIGKTSANVSGAVVYLARVKSNGSLEKVSVSDVTTDSDGKFVLETEVNGESNLVVVASKDDREWRAVVSAQVQSGITVYSQPLNEETSAEAEVYTEAKAKNYNNVYYANISSYVSSEVASEIKNDNNKAEKLAGSFNAMADAYARVVKSSEFGGSEAKWSAIVSASNNAQAQLERDLFYANSESAVDAAYNTYYDANINAYTNAGLSADTYSRALEISNWIFIKSNSSFSSEVRFHLWQRAAIQKARVINYAVQAKFKQIGATNAEIALVAAAGLQLTSSVRNANTEAGIRAAFDIYHDAVVAIFKTSLSIQTSVYNSLDDSFKNFRALLMASVNANTSYSAIANAYISFNTQIKERIEALLNTGNQTQMNATITLVVLLYMNF